MDLDSVLRAQAGVVTAAQARACDLAPRTVGRRVAEGSWRRLHPGVFLVGGHRHTVEVRVRAAWLWAGGAVSGPAAAWWHGMLPTAPEIVDLSVLRDRSPRAGLRIRRRRIPEEDLATVSGIRLTGRARTALETAAALPDGGVFLDRALQRYVGFAAVSEAYSRMLGAHGSAEAGRLLAAAADRAASRAERKVVTILRAAGLTGWELHLPFGPFELDVAFPEARVALEIDSWAWHTDVERFRTDRRKGNAVVTAGWTLLRFTWHDLDRAPERVVREIRTALDRAA
ncbi:type IV toxin-antitoxin system AbiEi family antitoxin domain-containing protein [Pseudonocardia ailaonensis]|uniref:Type IV toxin-antitoxin system AbiEi family antitoxin domain-containing protein n=1 Tax=Pseudonocardia ailaonensis TaxID=367279 RepID=A0ABN2ML64_9PSEU